MFFCEQCGAKMEDDSLFCPQCGTRVSYLPVPEPFDEETFDALRLMTDHGEEAVSAKTIRAALSAAAENEDEYAKLIPIISGRGAVSLIGYCPDTDYDAFTLQVVLNERRNRYDACYEKYGFTLEDMFDIFLSYAQTEELPADYRSWPRL